MKQTLEEAAKSMAYDKMPDWGGLPAVAKKYFIKGAEWQSKQSPWISVKERLPEELESVLVGTNSEGRYYYEVAFVMNGKRRWLVSVRRTVMK
jgi:hypothetical protein